MISTRRLIGIVVVLGLSIVAELSLPSANGLIVAEYGVIAALFLFASRVNSGGFHRLFEVFAFFVVLEGLVLIFQQIFGLGGFFSWQLHNPELGLDLMILQPPGLSPSSATFALKAILVAIFLEAIKRRWSSWVWIGFLVISAGVVISGSKTGIISLGLFWAFQMVPFLAGFLKNNQTSITRIALIGAMTVSLVLVNFQQFVAALPHRMTMWTSIASNASFTGVLNVSQELGFNSAHNTWWQSVQDVGWIGLLFVTGMLFAVFSRLGSAYAVMLLPFFMTGVPLSSILKWSTICILYLSFSLHFYTLPNPSGRRHA